MEVALTTAKLVLTSSILQMKRHFRIADLTPFTGSIWQFGHWNTLSIAKLVVKHHQQHCCYNGMLQFSKLVFVSHPLSCTEPGVVNMTRGKQRTFTPTREKSLVFLDSNQHLSTTLGRTKIRDDILQQGCRPSPQPW